MCVSLTAIKTDWVCNLMLGVTIILTTRPNVAVHLPVPVHLAPPVPRDPFTVHALLLVRFKPLQWMCWKSHHTRTQSALLFNYGVICHLKWSSSLGGKTWKVSSYNTCNIRTLSPRSHWSHFSSCILLPAMAPFKSMQRRLCGTASIWNVIHALLLAI